MFTSVEFFMIFALCVVSFALGWWLQKRDGAQLVAELHALVVQANAEKDTLLRRFTYTAKSNPTEPPQP